LGKNFHCWQEAGGSSCSGTGSYPLVPQGWQRNSLPAASQLPLRTPKRSIASAAYCEQVGICRQWAPISGDTSSWYPRIKMMTPLAVRVCNFKLFMFGQKPIKAFTFISDGLPEDRHRTFRVKSPWTSAAHQSVKQLTLQHFFQVLARVRPVVAGNLLGGPLGHDVPPVVTAFGP